MDDNADAKRILLASPPADWRRQLGHPCITWLITVQQDLRHHHLTLPEAADLAQKRRWYRRMAPRNLTVSCQKPTDVTVSRCWVQMTAAYRPSLLALSLRDGRRLEHGFFQRNLDKGNATPSSEKRVALALPYIPIKTWVATPKQF